MGLKHLTNEKGKYENFLFPKDTMSFVNDFAIVLPTQKIYELEVTADVRVRNFFFPVVFHNFTYKSLVLKLWSDDRYSSRVTFVNLVAQN